MSTYVIGDIQGCHTELCRLLELINFSGKHDRLWCVGDLVDRGPSPANVLRELMALGGSAQSVLGNHDFHLLVAAAGFQNIDPRDYLDDVIKARDCEDLLHWLRHRPLMFAQNDHLVVHAGLIPQWETAEALGYAREVEAVLHSRSEKTVRHFYQHLYGNTPDRWSPELQGMDRLRTIVNVSTRLRFCAADGTLNFREKRGIDHPPAGMLPWFEHENRCSKDTTLICGHWSMLGLSLMPRVLMLDSGCVWGGMLTAVRLEDRQVFQVPGQAR